MIPTTRTHHRYTVGVSFGLVKKLVGGCILGRFINGLKPVRKSFGIEATLVTRLDWPAGS